MYRKIVLFVTLALAVAGCEGGVPGLVQSTQTPVVVTATQVPGSTVVVVSVATLTPEATQTARVETATLNQQSVIETSVASTLESVAKQQPTGTPEPVVQPTQAPPVVPTDVVSSDVLSDTVANRATFKFHFPNASTAMGDGWSIEGLPTMPATGTVLLAQGMFVNTLGLGTESWLAEPGTLLVGPEFPQEEVDAADGAIEYISPINQQLITMAGQSVPVSEGRFQWCTAGGFRGQVNGVEVNLEYQEGHVWFFVIRGLHADGLQDSDRNHTLTLDELAAGHVQCMSYPGDGGGYLSEGNFFQVAEIAHTNARDCGAEGCSKLDGLFLDLNNGAWTLIHQDQLNAPWSHVASNWWVQP